MIERTACEYPELRARLESNPKEADQYKAIGQFLQKTGLTVPDLLKGMLFMVVESKTIPFNAHLLQFALLARAAYDIETDPSFDED